MTYEDFIKALQRGMGFQGSDVDGDPGPETQAALAGFDVSMTITKVLTAPTPVSPADDMMTLLKKQAPHVFEAIKYLGMSEQKNDKILTALCWPHTTDCRNLTTVQGNDYAWCAGFQCGIAFQCGLDSPHSGLAGSYATFGVACGYVFGAYLPIRHVGGGHHITIFLWWIDEAKRIAACLGGNQSDHVSIAAYNLSGNDAGHDQVVPGPRYFANVTPPPGPYHPDGWQVGTSLGGSTR